MAEFEGMPHASESNASRPVILRRSPLIIGQFLFRDPEDDRYWELTYPKGELQGGGPPRLTMLTPEKAHAKYEFTESAGGDSP